MGYLKFIGRPAGCNRWGVPTTADQRQRAKRRMPAVAIESRCGCRFECREGLNVGKV